MHSRKLYQMLKNARSYISSRDAYMLIYTRAPEGSAEQSNSAEDPQPPARALHVVEELNATHEEACEEYTAEYVDSSPQACAYTDARYREKAAEERFQQTRRMVMDIYCTWSLSNGDEDPVICSKRALEAWMSRHLTRPKDRKPDMLKEG